VPSAWWNKTIIEVRFDVELDYLERRMTEVLRVLESSDVRVVRVEYPRDVVFK
jgi:hypothetical protein